MSKRVHRRSPGDKPVPFQEVVCKYIISYAQSWAYFGYGTTSYRYTVGRNSKNSTCTTEKLLEVFMCFEQPLNTLLHEIKFVIINEIL
jgi:hypothetical protein